MKNKTATIITSHLPKFGYLAKLLDTFYENVEQPHDLYVVFSDEYEAQLFSNGYHKPFNTLVLPKNMRGYGSIVNVKKITAIKVLYDKYDWLGVYDCETEYVKAVNLDELYAEIGNRKYVKGNYASVGGDIIKKVATILGLDTNKRVINETKDFSLYWWFQDIPVYDTSEMNLFLEWLETRPNINQILNEYHCFEFLMYSLYMIAYRDWEVHTYDFHLDIGAVEQFRLGEEQRLNIIEAFQPHWSIDRTNHNQFPFVKLIVHSDVAV
jgi:hypothetical protein